MGATLSSPYRLLAVALLLLGAGRALLAWRRRRVARAELVRLPQRYGPWALVTGASSGLGAEFARQLAALGFNVALCARREDRLRALASELSAVSGVQSRVVLADLSQAGGVAAVQAQLGELVIDVVVANAGVGLVGEFSQQEPTRQRELVELNCTATMELCRAFAPGMRARRRGALVLVSSLSAFQPMPLHAVYAASKSFVSFLGVALWDELRAHGVDVLTVEPGTVETEFQTVSGSQAHAGMSAQRCVADTLLALAARSGPVVSPGGGPGKVLLGSLLPRSWVAPMARRRQERLLRGKH